MAKKAWRKCASCWGKCFWEKDAWVCEDCKHRWLPEDDPQRLKPPG